jgi:hypothetical protein
MFNLKSFEKFVKASGEEKDGVKKEDENLNYLDEERINFLQKEKAAVMERLKATLAELDEKPEEPVVFSESSNLRTVKYKDGNYYILGKGGREEKVSLGEIMTASL